jgi:hypothetical protein
VNEKENKNQIILSRIQLKRLEIFFFFSQNKKNNNNNLMMIILIYLSRK